VNRKWARSSKIPSFAPEQRELNEINSSIYCFTLAKLWPALSQVKPNNKHREIYLTDAIAELASKGRNRSRANCVGFREVLACNTRSDLAEVDAFFANANAKNSWQGV